MRLSELTVHIPTHEVEIVPGASITLRGLNFVDLQEVGMKYLPVLTSIYEDFMDHLATGRPFTVEDIKGMALEVVRKFPDTVAALVAAANDDPSSASTFLKLPMGTQLKAVLSVIDLTIVSEAEMKRVGELLAALIERATTMVPKDLQRTVAGFGKSASA